MFSEYEVGGLRPSVWSAAFDRCEFSAMSLVFILILGWGLILGIHPGTRSMPMSQCQAGGCHPGIRSMPVVPFGRSVPFFPVQGQCLSSQYEVGAFCLVGVPHQVHSLRPVITSVLFFWC